MKRTFIPICLELYKEWDYNKNHLPPQNYSNRSNKKVWWKCKNGHCWDASPNTRSKGHGCPYCSGNKTALEDSLLYNFPELCKEWDYEKNKIRPQNCRPKSNIRVWWKCSKEHSWNTSLSVRVGGHNCPYCDGQRATSDKNIIISDPIILSYWDYEKNI